MNKYQEALTEAHKTLAHDPTAALIRLENAMDDAFAEGAKSWAAILVSNAAIHRTHSGEASQAAAYYQRFLDTFGEDGRILFGLARVHAILGDHGAAIKYRGLTRQAAAESDDQDLLEILDSWESNEAAKS